MAWRFVKQPNGFLARFSTVVDHFTHINMTIEDAHTYCREANMGERSATEKIQAGVENKATMPDFPGQNRWEEALAEVEHQHGADEVKEFLDIYNSSDPKNGMVFV